MGGRSSRPRNAGSRKKLISVIIPTLNEEHNIADAIASALETESKYTGRSEVLVVDGGSKDQTALIAKQMGAKVVYSQPGRARQMNLGWLHSKGDCLLFLHADCRLPQRYRDMLHEAVYARKQAPAPSWGCFETIDADVVLLVPSKSLVCPSIAHFQSFFSLDVESLSDRINFVNDFTPEEEEAVKAEDAWAYRVGCSRQQQLLRQAVRFRTRRRHMPYGDQALFVTSTLFRDLGGFKELPIMEDYELVRRLRKHGPPAIVPHAIQTSGRRWQTVGFLQTMLTNQAIILAYHCGVPAPTLASWYRKAAP